MLQFLQPIWLWAAAGIIVPIIIHLWNLKEGKVLKVGSIAFLTESSKAYAKSFKVTDLLLLLLRCLLLIVLAVLIAKPSWEKQLEIRKEKGWVLIEKDHLHEAYGEFKPTIDTLIKAGYSFHYFNPGFEEAKLEEALKARQDSVTEMEVSYWTLLKDLDKKVPAKLPVYLVTDNKLRRFSGERPELALNLKWDTYTSSDTTSTWIQKAYVTTDDSIRLVVANSSSSGTYYTHKNITAANSTSRFSINVVDGKMFVFDNDTSNSRRDGAEVDTATKVIVIFTDKFGEDANYLRAAISAVRDFTKYKIKVSVINSVANIPVNYDWLFWLSEEKLTAPIKNNVFVYEKGKTETGRSVIITSDKAEVTSTESVPLFKWVSNSVPAAKNKTIWKNGFEDVVLSREEQNGSVYHFYSRFNPQWNDLSWSTSFPQTIYSLIMGEEANTGEIDEADKRILDATQIQPIITAATNTSTKQDQTERKDLSNIFWMIGFVLFALERMIVLYKKKEDVYG